MFVAEGVASSGLLKAEVSTMISSSMMSHVKEKVRYDEELEN